MITADQQKVLTKFLNSCKSAESSIKFWTIAEVNSAEQFKLYTKAQRIDFILNSIDIVDAEQNQNLNYKDGMPIVYEYIFIIRDRTSNRPGCLAFYHEPPEIKTKIKWQVKSLHYDTTGKTLEQYIAYKIEQGNIAKE